MLIAEEYVQVCGLKQGTVSVFKVYQLLCFALYQTKCVLICSQHFGFEDGGKSLWGNETGVFVTQSSSCMSVLNECTTIVRLTQ